MRKVRFKAIVAAAWVLLGGSAAVLGLGGPPSSAWAQTSGAAAANSPPPQIEPWPAPVGHCQPTRQDLPPGTSKHEGAITPGQRRFDDQLEICRC